MSLGKGNSKGPKTQHNAATDRRVEINRGDLFYIHKSPAVGSEQWGGRPGIIVSNQMNNRHSSTVEIVFLTTMLKDPDLPTHVEIDSAPRASHALCEQVTTVSVMRLGNYIGHVTDDEMERVDDAIRISLGLMVGERK